MCGFETNFKLGPMVTAGRGIMNVESSITAQAKDSVQIFNAQYGMATK